LIQVKTLVPRVRQAGVRLLISGARGATVPAAKENVMSTCIEKPTPGEVERVPCAVCQTEIPKDVALSSEDQDYVLYFCGPDCYEEWSNDRLAVQTQESGEP
jgi:hypothetical protein